MNDDDHRDANLAEAAVMPRAALDTAMYGSTTWPKLTPS